MFIELETERLILRKINNEDAPALYDYYCREEVTRYYGLEPFQSLKQAEELIEGFSKAFQDKKGIRWGIERKGEKGLIGTVGFNNWAPRQKRTEIGYELNPSHWRKGYISEAVLKVIEYGFQELELNRIGALIFPENLASKNLVEKLGFQQEGLLKHYYVQNGKPQDAYMFGLLKTSYFGE